ncbi:hypothetical protein, partial [Bordetella pertussis]|uniref:hypothetical protein n=1 Tax=Bordetella pertussis TaxID=520 RepID=UPI00387931D8
AGAALPGIAPSNAYPCRDGYVLIAATPSSSASCSASSAPTWATTPSSRTTTAAR